MLQISLLIQTRTLFTEEELLWIMDLLKHLNAGFVSSFVFSRCKLMDCVLLWCFYSDGTHSLQSIHCSDTFLQTWWRNKLIHISDDPKMIYSFNKSRIIYRNLTHSAAIYSGRYLLQLLNSVIKWEIRTFNEIRALYIFSLSLICCWISSEWSCDLNQCRVHQFLLTSSSCLWNN